MSKVDFQGCGYDPDDDKYDENDKMNLINSLPREQ